MTDDEEDRQIAADVRARRDLGRRLACLEGKKAEMRAGVRRMLQLIDSGPHSDDASRVSGFPSKEDVFSVLQEIENTQRELDEVNRRLDKY